MEFLTEVKRLAQNVFLENLFGMILLMLIPLIILLYIIVRSKKKTSKIQTEFVYSSQNLKYVVVVVVYIILLFTGTYISLQLLTTSVYMFQTYSSLLPYRSLDQHLKTSYELMKINLYHSLVYPITNPNLHGTYLTIYLDSFKYQNGSDEHQRIDDLYLNGKNFVEKFEQLMRERNVETNTQVTNHMNVTTPFLFKKYSHYWRYHIFRNFGIEIKMGTLHSEFKKMLTNFGDEYFSKFIQFIQRALFFLFGCLHLIPVLVGTTTIMIVLYLFVLGHASRQFTRVLWMEKQPIWYISFFIIIFLTCCLTLFLAIIATIIRRSLCKPLWSESSPIVQYFGSRYSQEMDNSMNDFMDTIKKSICYNSSMNLPAVSISWNRLFLLKKKANETFIYEPLNILKLMVELFDNINKNEHLLENPRNMNCPYGYFLLILACGIECPHRKVVDMLGYHMHYIMNSTFASQFQQFYNQLDIFESLLKQNEELNSKDKNEIQKTIENFQHIREEKFMKSFSIYRKIISQNSTRIGKEELLKYISKLHSVFMKGMRSLGTLTYLNDLSIVPLTNICYLTQIMKVYWMFLIFYSIVIFAIFTLIMLTSYWWELSIVHIVKVKLNIKFF
ncbi:hypothetical protein SNEBB_001406 [Seison nebaliae]|nr:hypothetical protein SNEBB_001406 [Seison nebaliae]